MESTSKPATRKKRDGLVSLDRTWDLGVEKSGDIFPVLDYGSPELKFDCIFKQI